MTILALTWSLLSLSLSFLQLLVLTQPEWIVRGNTYMGLFALCSPVTCILRDDQLLIPFMALLIGGTLSLLASLLLFPILLCTSSARPVRIVSNVQLFSAIMYGIAVIVTPFDMGDVECTLTELLRSSTCRVGWAYAVSSVCALLSMSCPILGRLVAEDRGIDYALIPRKSATEEFYL